MSPSHIQSPRRGLSACLKQKRHLAILCDDMNGVSLEPMCVDIHHISLCTFCSLVGPATDHSASYGHTQYIESYQDIHSQVCKTTYANKEQGTVSLPSIPDNAENASIFLLWTLRICN